MQYYEFLDRLQKYTNQKISQTEIAEALDISQSAIAKRISRESDFMLKDLFKAVEYFKTKYGLQDYSTLSVNQKNNTIAVDYYPDVLASCGNGAYELSQNCIKYDVPATLFPPSQNVKGYFMCHAKGNSMYPRIWDGDFVICEHKDDMKIENGEMYIFCFDDQIYLKRLTKNINQIVVESENPDFPTQYIEKEQMNDVHLIGHVICTGRMNGKYLDKRV